MTSGFLNHQQCHPWPNLFQVLNNSFRAWRYGNPVGLKQLEAKKGLISMAPPRCRRCCCCASKWGVSLFSGLVMHFLVFWAIAGIDFLFCWCRPKKVGFKELLKPAGWSRPRAFKKHMGNDAWEGKKISFGHFLALEGASCEIKVYSHSWEVFVVRK